LTSTKKIENELVHKKSFQKKEILEYFHSKRKAKEKDKMFNHCMDVWPFRPTTLFVTMEEKLYIPSNRKLCYAKV
jgi:hypothetical protein